MNLRAIPRFAVDRYLKAARWPVDTTVALLGRNGATTSAIDRIDATFRAAAATAFGDRELREDARRRREAADERDRSARLRDEAELREQRGREEAEQRRRGAQRRAGRTAQRRREATAKATARTQEAIHDRDKRARLDELDTRSEALGEREEALTARDEARRLGDAAARAKARRKS